MGSKGMKFLDPNDPFFRHAWVRWVSVLLPLFWGIIELFVMESPFWGLLFLAAGTYAGWQLFYVRNRD
jgi:hypothetical protein